MKDELGGTIKKEFVELTEKTYSYLTNDGSEYKESTGKKSVIKRKLKFEDYKNFLETTQLKKWN